MVASIGKGLTDDLVGIYLHGSLAMGSFNPARSDVDLLVVTDRPMGLEVKRRMMALLLDRSKKPAPIEISFLCAPNLRPWRFPTPYDLHFSEDWRQRYEADLAHGAWRQEPDGERTDPDLAAHITVLNRRGLCLWGKPIADVFPEVPA
ncbi:MAG TPA: nucleotidyltransferase domain-containing protein, partial [Trueperaceae bacterium]